MVYVFTIFYLGKINIVKLSFKLFLYFSSFMTHETKKACIVLCFNVQSE